jgi:hypothetical protein
LGILGSVNSKNLVPLKVWNTVNRKKDDSIDSMPDGATVGSGYVQLRDEELAEEVMGILGVKERVMAWTPWKVPASTR